MTMPSYNKPPAWWTGQPEPPAWWTGQPEPPAWWTDGSTSVPSINNTDALSGSDSTYGPPAPPFDPSGDVTYESVLRVLDKVHPDWSPESRSYEAYIVYLYMLQSGGTLQELYQNAQQFETPAESMFGNFNTYGGWAKNLSNEEIRAYYAAFDLQSTGDITLDRIRLGQMDTALQGKLQQQWQSYLNEGATPGEPEAAIWGEPVYDPNYGWVQKDQFGNYSPWQGDIPQPETYGEVLYDENGREYQIGPDGKKHYTQGTAPMGPTTDMPTQFAGWGQTWDESTQYNPATGKMEQTWNKKPMSAEATLAQGQFANLPTNWLDVGIMNRVLPQDQQRHNTYVGDVTGQYITNRQGYDPRYDLQAGQASTGITPAGYYDTAQDPNAWKQGYGSQFGGTGTGEGGGYQALNPSMQSLSKWGSQGYGQMQGMFGSGLMGQDTWDDYMGRVNSLRPSEGRQGLRWK